MRRSRVVFGALVAVAMGLAARGADWPKWFGPKGDGISEEKNLLEKWPEGGPKQLWSAKVGVGFSSPVIAGGKLYCLLTDGKKDVLTALDATTGQPLWKQSYDGAWTGAYPGARATPVIDGKRLYTLGGGGYLTCWNLEDGKTLWQTNILKETKAGNIGWGVASSPLVTDKAIYVQGGKDGPIAVCVDKATGRIAWTSEKKGLASYAAPILIDVGGKPQLIIFSADGVNGLDPATGKNLWGEPFKTGCDVNAAMPVFHDGKLFVTAGYGHGCMMLQVSAGGAQKLWENKNVKSQFPSPILEGDVMYANDDGKLKCVKWEDGSVNWTFPTAIGNGGSCLRCGDKLIILSEHGRLFLTKADPAAIEKISEFDVFPKADNTWTMPVLWAGKLYVHGKDELKCLQVGP